jgi:hypothetical protein
MHFILMLFIFESIQCSSCVTYKTLFYLQLGETIHRENLSLIIKTIRGATCTHFHKFKPSDAQIIPSVPMIEAYFVKKDFDH